MLKKPKIKELTRDEIGQLLATGGACGDLDPSDWVVEGPVIKTRRSDIYRASHPDFPSALCVKYSKPGERTNKSLLQEFKNLTTYSSIMAENPVYGVPKPVACLPEQGLLALEWIDGTSVKAQLASGPKAPQSRHILLTQAARWLKEFHRVGGAELILFEPQMLADQIDLYLKKKQILFEPCKKVAIKACRDFRRETERLPASQELYSFAHRDFTPGNVVITGDKVMGIDITKNEHQPVYEDMTRFFADLTVNNSMLSVAAQICLPFVDGWLRRDEKAIVTGYLGEAAQEKNKQILLYLLLHMTKKMIEATVLLSEHRQSLGFAKPFLLTFRYYRHWKRRLILYHIRLRLR